MTQLSIEVDTRELKSLIRRVEGIDEIINDLASEQALQEAQRRVPVLSGDLRKTIRREVRGKSWALIAGGDGVTYAIWVEFGTSRAAAQPFMLPALNSIKWSSILKQALRRVGLK